MTEPIPYMPQLSNKCPQNDTKRNKRKSALFVVVGILAILLGLGLFLDKQLNGYHIYFIIFVGMGVVVLLAGIYGVCFLNNIRLRRH
jgi:uncharacterized membrane protein HdeD (DUF308 family)